MNGPSNAGMCLRYARVGQFAAACIQELNLDLDRFKAAKTRENVVALYCNNTEFRKRVAARVEALDDPALGVLAMCGLGADSNAHPADWTPMKDIAGEKWLDQDASGADLVTKIALMAVEAAIIDYILASKGRTVPPLAAKEEPVFADDLFRF